jgi:hypothetical protein
MDKNGMFGELLEQGQQVMQNTVKSAVSDVAGAAAGQIGIKNEKNSSQQKVQSQVQNQTQAQPQQPTENVAAQAESSPETLDLVKEFYAPSDDVQAVQANPVQEQAQTQAKLAKLRQELHQTEYYEPLIAYETKKPGQGEEATSEKLEREEKEEEQEKMVLEEKKAKEDQDIATTRAKTAVEANRGVAG